MFKKGFTLAEVMIVLTVIGILAGILIPVANNSRPDEKVMKFKKAHATLANVIHELVTSDKYYGNGDLGLKPDGTTLIDGTHTGDYTYLCNTIADIVSAKKVQCTEVLKTSFDYHRLDTRDGEQEKIRVDNVCKNLAKDIGAEIITSDNIVYYQTSCMPFGAPTSAGYDEDSCTQGNNCAKRLYGGNVHVDSVTKFDRIYKIYCIDIDGIPNEGSGNCDDIKDVCPFGYGIRADGKILTGARADEWLEKGFQKGKKDN